MDGSESESASQAIFDADNLDPQLFINQVLNAVDDLVDGAFDFALQQASVITAGGDPGSDRSDELARGNSFLRQRTQDGLDKSMAMWEKYCQRHCFAVPEGFVMPKSQDPSGSGLLEGFSEAELKYQIHSLRKKLAAVGQESAELQRELHVLEKQSTMSSSYNASIAEILQLYEENSVQETFQELGKRRSELVLKAKAAKSRSSWSKEQNFALDQRLELEDIQQVLSDMKGADKHGY